ncbi:MAG: site-specific tyrosine recombinase XerC [Myxococcales bacterium]
MGRPWPKKPVPESAKEPDGLHVWLLRYLEWLRVRHYSERTVVNREKAVGLFIEWSEARGVLRPMEVTKPMLERYQRHLYYVRKADGRALSARGQVWRLGPVRAYFKWLTRQNVLLWNPASELELPRTQRRLPKHVLSVSEVEKVLALPDVKDVFGLRDRALLETLYSTGIRRKELIGLGLFDIDTERGTLHVREGKGGRERVVPIGERARLWIDKYVSDARPELLVPPDAGVLFLTRFGEAFRPGPLTNLVRGYVDRAELGKTGSCHLFRHTLATVMLEHGADIRYIQEMLGHAELSTTEIYTQVSIRKLCAVYAATHPAALLVRKSAPERPPLASTARAVTADELFSCLAAEVDEDDDEPALDEHA